MPTHSAVHSRMKGACALTSVGKLCEIPLNLVLASKLAAAIAGATEGNVGIVTEQLIWIIAFALLLLIIQLIEKVTIQKLVLRMENRCKLDFLGEVIDNPLYKLFGADYGELTENLNDDIETSSKRYTELWPVMITGVVSTFVYIAYLLQGSPLIAITIFGISLLQLMPPVIIKRYMQINYEDCRKIEAKITDQITEAVMGFDVIKLYGLAKWWQRRMAALHKDYIIVGNKSEATATAQISMEKLLDNILKYGTYAILGVYAMFKICPIEEALFGIALSPSLFASVKNTFSAIPDISVANVSDGRLKKWHDANKCDNVTLNDGGVSLNNVKCNYDANTVINHVTYKFEENKVYAIKGRNGSGKSTLVYLIAGLLLPSEGHLKVGGVEPMNFSERTYLNDIFWMPQHDPEFDVSVHELFEMFGSRCSMSELMRTAFRLGLPVERINACTLRELSGGERKKAILAIAFTLQHRILLLDEPTNFLDEQAEKEFLSLLHERKGTTIVVSHDTVCCAAADVVLTIENGEIRHATI